MITDKIQRDVANVFFGVQGLNTHSKKVLDEQGNVIDSIQPLSIWIASVSYFRPYQAIPNLVVAIVLTDKWHKGLLLIPPIREPFDREYGGPNPGRPVHLTDWNDPVTNNLKSVDLVPDLDGPLSSSHGYDYHLFISTQAGFAHLHYDFMTENLSLTRLWKSLLSAIYHLAKLYNDDEINEFIDLDRRRDLFGNDTI